MKRLYHPWQPGPADSLPVRSKARKGCAWRTKKRQAGPCARCRLLQLMRARKVKRIVLLSDGRTAIVDVPVENTESNFETMKYDRRDLR